MTCLEGSQKVTHGNTAELNTDKLYVKSGGILGLENGLAVKNESLVPCTSVRQLIIPMAPAPRPSSGLCGHAHIHTNLK